MASPAPSVPKVCLLCTGVGIMNRGIESFFRECFDGLHGRPGMNIELVKGAGPDAPDEHKVFCLPRTGTPAKLLGKLIRRNAYVAEQLSSYFSVVKFIRRHRPDVILYSDANLAMQLYKRRDKIGVPFKLIYSNGAPLHPPYKFTDHVQQVAPFYYDEAINYGEPAGKHSMVPYGIVVPPGPPPTSPELKTTRRRELGLPENRPIILSVGWIAAVHKRMDYTIREIASLPGPRPYLVMLGAMDHETPPVIKLADELLGRENYAAVSVPYQKVVAYYQAADIFTLASLREGFGRVYLEALMHGLPSIVHNHQVMQFVLGDQGIFSDFSQPGGLAKPLAELLRIQQTPEMAAARRESVRNRFSWDVLAEQYRQMFERVAFGSPLPQTQHA